MTTSKPDSFREQARKMREAAARAKDAKNRKELLFLAQQYERLADKAEKYPPRES